MSFGAGDTPITSDDEDNDQQQQVRNNNNGGSGSNFIETHENEMIGNETPISDNDSDENMNELNQHNNNGDVDSNEIQIHFEGNLISFPIQSQHETLSDLRQRINSKEDGEKMTDCHYFSLPRAEEDGYYDNNDEDEEELRNSGRLLSNEDGTLLSNYRGDILSVYWKSFEITIVDGMDLKLNLRVSQDWTIKKLKEEVEKTYAVRLQCLSHGGMELIDTYDLQYYSIMKSGFTLISRISISIEDYTCEIATDLLICDFWDFEKVLTTYLDAERRELHKSASFSYLGKRVDMNESVYNHNLTNRSKLEYKVDAYPINIYDSERDYKYDLQHQGQHNNIQSGDLNAYTLNVYDFWTLNDVKKAYSKSTKKPFMEKEKFLSQERELEDNVPLWKLRIRDNEKLIIEREAQEIVCNYICCECGSKVELRRYDSVQCRQCFLWCCSLIDCNSNHNYLHFGNILIFGFDSQYGELI